MVVHNNAEVQVYLQLSENKSSNLIEYDLNNIYIKDDFLLTSKYAIELYEKYSKDQPIIDYHCHLDPRAIAENKPFNNIGQMWLEGDHYKWRAMRAAGINEDYITGNASWEEKFNMWAETIPLAMRNPLYHWTHLELKQAFGVDDVLSTKTASKIWEECNAKLATGDYSPISLIKKFKVEVICTTDDIIDSLEYHRIIKEKYSEVVKVLPTWRPDKLLNIESSYNEYLNKLEEVSGVDISSFKSLLNAIEIRAGFFKENGCILSDHGLSTFYSTSYIDSEIENIFSRLRQGKEVSTNEKEKYYSAILYELAVIEYEQGWAVQYHIGPIRNNATSMFTRLGADIGYDAMDDKQIAASGFKFFDRLYSSGKLAKTILYNLNPKDSDMLAVMANTYNEYPIKGKMQYGAAWWFLDTERGIRNQIDTYSDVGLLGCFVGMLTDSRSFLSYPRHDYFRRILCDVLGNDLSSGRLPTSEIDVIGEMVSNISYYNIKKYIGA